MQRSSAHQGSVLKGSLSPGTNRMAVRDPRGSGYLWRAADAGGGVRTGLEVK